MNGINKRFLYFLAYFLTFGILGLGAVRLHKLLPKTLTEIPEISIENDREPADLIKVIDGDTIKVIVNDTEHSIRLIGINAPEQHMCGYEQSTLELEHLLNDKNIFLETDETQGNMDKYDRLLRYVFTDDGTNVNAELLKLGAAEEYTYDKDYKYKTIFLEAQNEAKENNRGVWNYSLCVD